MSVIGGYYGGRRARCDGAALTEISRSMIESGGRREAFIKGRIGLSVGVEKNFGDDSGLYFFENDGEVFASVVNGHIDKGGEELLLEYARQKSLDEELPVGNFSAAVCDGRNELLIFRSGEGSPPLYYGVCDGDFAFASRIKGLMGFLGGCFVKTDILRDHLTAAAGKYNGEDLYCGVCGVESGGGLRFTPTGVSRIFLKAPKKAVPQKRTEEGEGGELVCPDGEKMRELLMEILMAFDYPQFDAFMPTFLSDIQKGEVVTDHSLCMDTAYAEERSSRLFALCGKGAKTVPPVSQSYGEKELGRMDDILSTILKEDENEVYERVMGKLWLNVVEKEKNTARRIRMKGMLWQTAFWYDKYNVALV